MIDLPDIATAIRMPNLWDNPFNDALLAMSAAKTYYQREQDDLRPMQPTTSDVKIIMAGVQSCILANQVLCTKWENPESPEAKVAVASALTVLKYWGIEIKDVEPKPTNPAPEPAPAPAEMIWPPVHLDGRPRFSALPDVYKENYYHVYEDAARRDPANPIVGFLLTPEDQLLLQKAYWSEEAMQWRLQMLLKREGGDQVFWINHCQVKPGEEIGAATEPATPEPSP